MTERAFYVEAEGATKFRAYVARENLLSEIERLFAAGFVKVNAKLEPEQAERSGGLARARALALDTASSAGSKEVAS